MKKLFFTSGVLTLIFGFLFISGVLDFNHTVSRALTTGNQQYAEENFNDALAVYETGLQKEATHPKLNYNAAQASYRVQAYAQAIEFYGKASGAVDLYLNWGNSSLRLGDGTEDINQKLQYYTSALETYKQGILSFPQSIELKYNYEFVLEKIKALQENNENQQQNDNQDNQEGQDQNQQQGSGQDGNQQEQQDNQGNEGNPQDNQQDGSQSENNPGEGQDNEQQNSEDQQSGSSGQDDQQNSEDQQSESSGENEQQNPEDQQSDSPSQNEQQEESSPASDGEENNDPAGSAAEESIQNSSEIERILQMLEKQEDQALKNNQQIIDSGKEDEHDW